MSIEFRQRLERFFSKYIKKEEQRQELVIDFLMIHVGLRPTYFFEEDDLYTDPEFINDLNNVNGNWNIEIGPFSTQNETVCAVISKANYDWVRSLLDQVVKRAENDPQKYVEISEILGYPCPGYPLSYWNRDQRPQNNSFDFDNEELTQYINYAIEFVFTRKRTGLVSRHLSCWFNYQKYKEVVDHALKMLTFTRLVEAFKGYDITFQIKNVDNM